jgi:hypothetical protein
MPLGLEMAVKLMLPGEESEVYMDQDFGFRNYEGWLEGVEGVRELAGEEPVVAVVELVDFEKEGHPQAMNAEQARINVLCLRSVTRFHFVVLLSCP